MANKKISALTAATTPLAGTEVAPIVQGGATVKAAITSFTNALNLTPASVTVQTGNVFLNGGLASDVGLIKNTGQSYGVGTDRWIGSDGTTSTWFYNVPTGGNHYFAINNVNKLTVVGDNVTLPAGNLVIGTSGKGIDFSATPGTGTSELLADYEEGTWTPNLTNMIVVGSPAVAGTYTKIGRMVYFECRVSATSIASTAGTSYISGLPFTAGQVSAFIAINASSSVALGSGQVNGTILYTPTFSPLGATISCSGSYEV
jgi:hypothetical protein